MSAYADLTMSAATSRSTLLGQLRLILCLTLSGGRPPTTVVCRRIIVAASPLLSTDSFLSSAAPPFEPRRVTVRWQRPPHSWFKLNFDGSVYEDGSKRASIGGAIRDINGQVLMTFAETMDHSTVEV